MSIPRQTIKKLFIASDHAGINLKNHLVQAVSELPWVDLGTHSEESVDYPDFADQLASNMHDSETEMGVLICGSGQGVAIRANRHFHIRAALCWNEEVARISRQHNNANVLCLGERTMDFDICDKILLTFLDTEFEGGRHQRRTEKLSAPLPGNPQH